MFPDALYKKTLRAALGVLACILIALPPAQAQNCRISPEEIVKLVPPRIGSYNIWDLIYGESEYEERFTYALTRPEWRTFVAGERIIPETGTKTLIAAQLDHRGRPEWEAQHEIEELRAVIKVLPDDETYVVLANLKNKIWLGRLSKDGALLTQKSLADRKGHIQAHDIMRAPDGHGFVLLTTFSPAGKGQVPHTRLYVLTDTLKVKKHRAFFTGTHNAMKRMAVTPEGHILAAGYIEDENGRRNGWIMRLNEAHNMVWQRRYPRGRSANLNAIENFDRQYAIAAGRSKPTRRSGKASDAAWVMMLNTQTGDPLWQRYYTDTLHNEGRSVLVHDNGLISMMQQGKPVKKDGAAQDFVRVLTLNAYGMLLGADSYFNGQGARALHMMAGPRGERIITGQTDITETIEGPESEPPKTIQTRNGWVLVGAKSSQYVDPCAEQDG